ncbi:CoA transferase subunit A [Chloroflexota bacterium]
MNKVVATAEEAIADIPDGATIAVAGCCQASVPRFLMRALVEKGLKDITIAGGCGPLLGMPEETVLLIKNGQLKKVIDSYGLNPSTNLGAKDPFEQAVRAGEIEYEVCPMGTLAEKYRAAGAGIPAFYTATGINSMVEEHILSSFEEGRIKRETAVINGQKCILEYALKPDFAFVHAYAGDKLGNVMYRKTGRNFGPVMAAAARVTIIEVENVVELGEIDPDDVHTPGIHVQRIVPLPPLLCEFSWAGRGVHP